MYSKISIIQGKHKTNLSDLIREFVTFYYKENESRDYEQPFFFFPLFPSSNPSLPSSNFLGFLKV
jgi:hypothetical protein